MTTSGKLAVRAFAAAAALLAAPAAIAQQVITIGDVQYPAYQAKMHLMKILIEEKLGGQVELKPAGNPVMYAGMDAGEGDIDIHADAWMPNQQSFYQEYVVEKGTVAYTKNTYPATSGFCTTKAFAEANNISSIYDLARPEIASLMDNDGDGMGEIWIGAPNWAATNVNEVKLRDYGISAFSTGIRADQSVNIAALKDAERNGKGYAFYCFRPDAIWYTYDLVELEEPAYSADSYKMVQPKDDPDWMTKSMVATRDPEKTVQIAYSKSLESRFPAVVSLIENIDLTNDIVSEWSFEIAGNSRAPEAVVGEWIANNPERVDRWLGLN